MKERRYPPDDPPGVVAYLKRLHAAEDYHEEHPPKGARSRRRLWKKIREILRGAEGQ